VAHSTMISNSD